MPVRDSFLHYNTLKPKENTANFSRSHQWGEESIRTHFCANECCSRLCAPGGKGFLFRRGLAEEPIPMTRY